MCVAMANDDDDRRQQPRIAVALQGHWDSREGTHACRITNLSRGGCYVEADVLPPKGAVIRLVIDLSAVTSLTTQAEVMHERPSGIGVHFVNLDPNQQDILASAWAAISRSRRV